MTATVTVFLAAQGNDATANVRMRMEIAEYVSDRVAAIAPDLWHPSIVHRSQSYIGGATLSQQRGARYGEKGKDDKDEKAETESTGI
jgi:hypothetical protein